MSDKPVHIEFVIDPGIESGYLRWCLISAIPKEAVKYGLDCAVREDDALDQTRLHITLDGNDWGAAIAYEAALKHWALERRLNAEV